MNNNINNLTDKLKDNLKKYNEKIKDTKIPDLPDLSQLNTTLVSLKDKFNNIYVLLNEINDKLLKNDNIEIKLDEDNLKELNEINKLNLQLNEHLKNLE